MDTDTKRIRRKRGPHQPRIGPMPLTDPDKYYRGVELTYLNRHGYMMIQELERLNRQFMASERKRDSQVLRDTALVWDYMIQILSDGQKYIYNPRATVGASLGLSSVRSRQAINKLKSWGLIPRKPYKVLAQYGFSNSYFYIGLLDHPLLALNGFSSRMNFELTEDDEISASDKILLRSMPLKRIATDPTSSLEARLEILKRLDRPSSWDDDFSLAEILCSQKDIPMEFLSKRALDLDCAYIENAQEAILGRSDTPGIVLEELLPLVGPGTGRYAYVELAKHPNCPSHLLDRFVHEENESFGRFLRDAVGTNPNASLESLTLLSKSDDVSSRAAVAKNRKAPKALLENLSEDREDWVRREAAKNKSTPDSLLVKLNTDWDLEVVYVAASTYRKRVLSAAKKAGMKDLSWDVKNSIFGSTDKIRFPDSGDLFARLV